MCWSMTGGSWRTPCGRNWPGAVRSTTSTTGWRPSTSPPPASRSCWGRRSGWWWATARWASRSCPPSCRLWWTAKQTFWCAPPLLRRASTFPTSIPSSWRTPTGWALPSSTRSGGGSDAVPAGLTPTSPTGRGRSCRRPPPSGWRPSGSTWNSAPALRSPCGIWRSGARAICWDRSSPAT